jgi:ElaB/YqjD/DUF883 family membrane-anchored ribosome-binding protein
VADYLRDLAPDEQEQAVVHAVEVGGFCLERARAGQKLDFVRREIDGLLNSVKGILEKIPDETQKQLVAKIGTGDGQVLAPVQSLVQNVSKAANEKLQEIRTLLQEDVDPTKETSCLGKALRALRELLHPKRSDSIHGFLGAAVNQVVADNGPLAKAVKDVVAETLKPLEERVNDVAKEVRGQEAAAEALEQTTHKGTTYEDGVVQVLQGWASGVGYEVHHVGTDNRPGDVVLLVTDSAINGTALRIVVEASDRQNSLGRMAIAEAVSTAMAERGANAAVYVSKTRDGLAKEIGDWAEGAAAQGRWVAYAHEHLVTAARFLVVQERLQAVRAATPTVDASSIEGQVQRIGNTLGRIKTINTKVTDLRSSADEIQREAEAVRDEIRSALSDVEDALRGGTDASAAQSG